MAFATNNDLVFIDSLKFMNSSLTKLVKNLSDNDFKYHHKNLVVFVRISKTKRSLSI